MTPFMQSSPFEAKSRGEFVAVRAETIGVAREGQ
jgi:hypothetical protein